MSEPALKLTAAEAAKVMGVSVESVRRAGVVRQARPDLAEQVSAGTLSLEAAYREVAGERRVGLYAKVQPHTRDLVKRAAAARGITTSELIDASLVLIFGAEELTK